MKKFSIIALAAIVCLAFSMPAMAKVQVGGMINLQVYYFDESEEAVVGGVTQGGATGHNGTEDTFFDLTNPLNRLYARYNNEDNSVIGYIQLRGGGQHRAHGLAWYYGWIMWQFHPMLRLQIGRQSQSFAIMAPGGQSVGFHMAHGLLAAFGNHHGGSSRDMVKLHIKFNDMIRGEIALVNPYSDGADVGAAITATPAAVGVAGAVVDEETVIPRIDLALNIKAGNFVIEPSFTYLQQEFDQTIAGADDDIESWGVALGIRAGFGMFTFTGEVSYGDNLHENAYAPNPVTAPGKAQAYLPAGAAAGATRVSDTEILSFFAQLGIKLGAATLNGFVGMCDMENDGDPAVPRNLENGGVNIAPNAAFAARTVSFAGPEFHITRWAYGASLPISVAKGFTIKPEVTFFDFDDDAELSGSALSTDLGDETVIGVEFMLVF
jgi:hypothetical protein